MKIHIYTYEYIYICMYICIYVYIYIYIYIYRSTVGSLSREIFIIKQIMIKLNSKCETLSPP